MKTTVEFKLDNIFRAKDFKDPSSGELKIGKYKVQTIENVKSQEGTQMKMIDISVPNELGLKLKDKIGEIVKIEVGIFVNNGKVGYYGV